MPEFLRYADNHNQPLIAPGHRRLPRTYFNLVKLDAGQTWSTTLDKYASVLVALSGKCHVTVGARLFKDVGQRPGIWHGPADSVYVPAGVPARIDAQADCTEIAVAGGRCDVGHEPFRIAPGDVQMVEVGSAATHSRRRIFHILGQKAQGRAGNLLVSELAFTTEFMSESLSL